MNDKFIEYKINDIQNSNIIEIITKSKILIDDIMISILIHLHRKYGNTIENINKLYELGYVSENGVNTIVSLNSIFTNYSIYMENYRDVLLDTISIAINKLYQIYKEIKTENDICR